MRAPHPRLLAVVRALLRAPLRVPVPPHPALAKAVAHIIRPPLRDPEAGPELASEDDEGTPHPDGSS